jgi:hypothetical protein
MNLSVFQKFTGSIGVVAASFFTTLYLTEPKEPAVAYGTSGPCAAKDGVSFFGPFSPIGGFAYQLNLAQFKDVADTVQFPSRSTLILCERGKPLGPAHSTHDDIRKKGLGRYSHWDGYLVFSTSDNSNPDDNDRTYVVVVKR